MSNIRIVLAVAACLVILATANASWYECGFESPDYTAGVDVNGQQDWVGSTSTGYTQPVSADVYKSGSQSLQVGEAMTTGGLASIALANESAVQEIQFSYRPQMNTANSSKFFFFLRNGSNQSLMNIRFQTGNILYNDTEGNHTMATTFNPGSWYDFTITVDFEAGTFDISGVGPSLDYSATGATLTGSATQSGSDYTFGLMYNAEYTGDTSSWSWGYIDDIAVSAVPEPATISLIAAGGFMLIRRKKRFA